MQWGHCSLGADLREGVMEEGLFLLNLGKQLELP